MYKSSLVEGGGIRKAEKSSFRDVSVETVKPKNIELRPGELGTQDNSHEWKYLGDYKKGVLLIVRYPGAPYLPDQQLNFLTSVLTACKLGLADVAILNLSNAPEAAYKAISDHFISRVTVLFGITPGEFAMPVNFPEFQVQAFNNCTFLHTPILEELEADKILKSKLWVCLRRIFELP
jgi:hypothetical protein